MNTALNIRHHIMRCLVAQPYMTMGELSDASHVGTQRLSRFLYDQLIPLGYVFIKYEAGRARYRLSDAGKDHLQKIRELIRSA